MRRTEFVFVLVIALAAASCSKDTATTAAATSTTAAATTTTALEYEPVFTSAPCDATRVPPAPAVVECGTLTVPANRSKADSTQIVLPVAILKASKEPKQPDPIIYFSGGPGDAGLQSSIRWDKLPLAPDHDVITFDQRGTGASTPSLDCPEVDTATLNMFETPLPPAQEGPAVEAAFSACHDRLVTEGIDLGDYNTINVADDVADLKRALKIGTWNLFGISYGTAVALEVMRSHPEGVRSTLIDSVYPPDVGFGAATFDDADRVFNVLIDGCAKQPTCAADHPDLRAELQAAVDRLDTTPYSLDIKVKDRTLKGQFTGTDLVGGLFNAMYDSDLIPLIPYFIKQVADGNVAILNAVASDGIATLTEGSEAQTASVECGDRQRLIDQDAVQKSIALHPLYGLIAAGRPLPQICPAWKVPSAPKAYNTIPTTKIPTLVFGDEYDPITPPANSERTAKALGSKATFVLFPGLGHGAIRARPCPLQIYQAFVAAPTAVVDTGCVAAMPAPDFKTG